MGDIAEPQLQRVLQELDRPIQSSASELQRNVKSVYKYLDINPVIIVNPKCPTKECQATFFDIADADELRKVPEACPECQTPLKDGQKFIGQHFPRQSLQAALEYLFSIEGIERLVEDQELLRKQQDERDKANPPSYLKDANIGKIYRHQLDGECYQQGGATADVHQRGCLVLTINIHIDWADPSKSRNRLPHSMGPILCQLADLPNQYRSKSTFAMLMGITPAPNEPPGCLLHRLLLALGVDILTGAYDGIWIRTPAHPNGRKVYIKIGAICCDRPAAIAIIGGGHYKSKKTPCLMCTIPASQLSSSSPFPAHLGSDHSEAMLNQQRKFLRQFDEAPQTSYQTHISRRAGRISQATQVYLEGVEKSVFKVPGHLSIFYLFPGFDKIRHAVADPMHTILEGLLLYYIRRVLIMGRLCKMPPLGWRPEDEGDAESAVGTESEMDEEELREVHERIVERSAASENPRQLEGYQRAAGRALKEDLDANPIIPKKLLTRLEAMMEQVIVPPYIDSVGKGFFTKQRKPTAAQWRTFGELFAIVRYTFQSAISEAQISRLHKLIDSFLELVIKLHPYLPARVTNFHVIRHIPDHIINHGPVYGWWLMAMERLNGRVKHVNMSGRNMFQEQVIAFRALLRERSAFLLLRRMLRSKGTNDQEPCMEELREGYKRGGIDSQLSEELETLGLFDNSGLDQRFSIDLLSRGPRTQAIEDKEVVIRLKRELQLNTETDFIDKFEFHHELAVRGYRFRPADPMFKSDWQIDPKVEIPRLITKKNAMSFLECRPAYRRFADHHAPARSGILWSVVGHKRRSRDGAMMTERLYAVTRWFKWQGEYGQANGYRYNQEATLDIYSYSDSVLDDPFFFEIRAATIGYLHPLALIRVPVEPNRPTGRQFILSIPIARHT
ncbi:hypothetical protein L198_06246 [Cryptococcus wingfieldii CBS 7118]|uniref:Transposase domain-containing protein n=1 Tax=Cryptococcus wingfieldii CBS 7118 TaxID=1295528 RepID=A0A1E3INW1_9TREE|nr:hypothetical protein L198_06246 [Cryptococcus wingfieldii CBS 7118]ODN90228.1 hypothetical protein L198_06246 [Cryptococcus wingfieldii CBS 7118]